MELNVHNMQKYIGGPVKVKTMFIMLQNDLDTGSKIMYLDAMKARVFFYKDVVMEFGDTITQYQD